MSNVTLMGMENGIARQVCYGDFVTKGCAAPATVSAVGATTLTVAQLASGAIIRTGQSAGATDTLPTAVQIATALINNGGSLPDVGDAFEVTYANDGGFTITFAMGTGITAVYNNTVATKVTRRLLFVCTAVGTNTFASGVWTNTGATFDFYTL